MFALALLTGASAALASAGELPQQCHAFTGADVTATDALSEGFAWTCGEEAWRADSGRAATWLRFDARKWAGEEPPKYLSLRHSRYDGVGVVVVDEAGATRRVDVPASALTPADYGPFAFLALPQTARAPTEILVRIAGPELNSTGSQARVVADGRLVGWPRQRSYVLIMIAGLVCAPLLLNLGLFPVLRHRFMLAHAGLSGGMLLCLLTTSGMLGSIVRLETGSFAGLVQFGYVIIVTAAGLFAVSFLERGALSAATRRALLGAAAFAFLLSGGLALGSPIHRAIDPQFYMLGFLPMLVVTLAALVQAVRRGSRWVWYLILGWVPAIATGLDMVATGFGLQPIQSFGLLAPFIAMAFDVLVTGAGVIHRVLIIRHERDAAIQWNRSLKELSARDPLTGALNRRAIDSRFDRLVSGGFTTWALLDLDRFKSINDEYGHPAGDEVLRATVEALSSDRDCHVVRMGGEEFLLLLRGEDTRGRAERARRAITHRVRERVAELEQPVTASMGVLDFADVAREEGCDFGMLYSRADQLLYRAKDSGRNQSVFKRLELFDPERLAVSRRAAA